MSICTKRELVKNNFCLAREPSFGNQLGVWPCDDVIRRLISAADTLETEDPVSVASSSSLAPYFIFRS